MKTILVFVLASWASAAFADSRCAAPGEPVLWVADYCMLQMETDDEIAVSGCIEKESRIRFADLCTGNLHFKRRMCELMIRSDTKSGTVEQCVGDPAFRGRTVEAGGVGG